jgi:hypothetical protein
MKNSNQPLMQQQIIYIQNSMILEQTILKELTRKKDNTRKILQAMNDEVFGYKLGEKAGTTCSLFETLHSIHYTPSKGSPEAISRLYRLHPFCTSNCAAALPIPYEAPVIMAVILVKSMTKLNETVYVIKIADSFHIAIQRFLEAIP